MRPILSSSWRTFFAIVAILLVAVGAVLVAPKVAEPELRKALYSGALSLVFVGVLGGLLKIVLDDIAVARAKRANAGLFVTNVLTDLKSVYDRVGRARILIPAHQSVKTYGDEMRALIHARVQLRNVVRALERRPDIAESTAMSAVTPDVTKMEKYLDQLTAEFQREYKTVSNLQRAYEEKCKRLIDDYVKQNEPAEPPVLPGFPWERLLTLPVLFDFISSGPEYRTSFEQPLDDASKNLREELARVNGR